MPRLKLFFLFCCLLPLTDLWSQECSGNLGENIFTEGDFGSGAANIPSQDPMIAPGFIYSRNPPPIDGFYTLTNSMVPWNNPWASWRSFGDNSDDPNGYMMVVNAAFEPGLFYEQRVDGLCDGTTYQFSADVTNIYFRDNFGILPNVSFLLDGEVMFDTGNIAEDEEWHTYAFAFATEPGQTSVTLALRNNAPGGIGNDLAIDNIAFRACGPEARVAGAEITRICEDGSPATISAEIIGDDYEDPAVQWQQSFDEGTTWVDISGANDLTYLHTNLNSGFYYYRYLLANGANLGNAKCRVVSNEKTIYVVPKRYEAVDTICAGLSYPTGNQLYTQTGVYVDTLLSSLGCDSIVTLQLEVWEDVGISPDFDINEPSCADLSDGRIQLLEITNAAAPLEFWFADSLQGARRLFPNLKAGDYPYRIVDRFGCAAAGAVRLDNPSPFILTLTGDRVLDLGATGRVLTGSTQDIADYSWSPAGITDCVADCEVLMVTPSESFTLRVNAISVNGCSASDSLRILVNKTRNVYPPNSFSPNGDGINDFFTLFAGVPNVTTIEYLRVYNRWGAEVFNQVALAPNDASQGWDGELNGEPAAVGTYTYLAEVRFLDGAVKAYQGSFVLLR